MNVYRYAVRYRRTTIPSRIVRMTVNAMNADDARLIVAARDPEFDHTTESPRRGAKVELVPPDPVDEAKRRDDLLSGVAHFDWRGHDIEVEVT